ncbi:MAG: hypothetical protein CSYNP_02023 [Syntrophus sp. SKADARSKE-3]|nr:hypothetical protein [Syntrophus sp. SKADARSKE-3]
MKKMVCIVLLLIMAVFLINPSGSEARWGYWRVHGGWGWWGPAVVVGGAAVVAPYYGRYYGPYYGPYYSPYYYDHYIPPPVVIKERVIVPEQTPLQGAASSERVFIYPRQGQTEAQQANDRYECHRWSVGQTGFDPTQPPGNKNEAQMIQMRGDYNRALSACLDGRGYTMK